MHKYTLNALPQKSGHMNQHSWRFHCIEQTRFVKSWVSFLPKIMSWCLQASTGQIWYCSSIANRKFSSRFVLVSYLGTCVPFHLPNCQHPQLSSSTKDKMNCIFFLFKNPVYMPLRCLTKNGGGNDFAYRAQIIEKSLTQRKNTKSGKFKEPGLQTVATEVFMT